MSKTYDAIVVGAGHAGVEAAHALAAMGHNTLIISMTLDAIAFLACNPNIGGTGKGHLVKEVDALGGLMGELADKATIQTRMLNLGNGPAVHSLRAQVDKSLYHRLAKAALETTPNLTVLEGEAVSLLCENGAVCGIQTALGETLYAKAVILCTGVYLASRIITGEYVRDTGPNGFSRSGKLSQSLAANGLSLVRFKTGTPARILASSIDFSKMEPQFGDKGIPTFSFMTEYEVRNDYLCYLTYTNKTTHDIILRNLDRAPLYNGTIEGVGPRYCPSIESKIMRFKDKDRHQVFIEPEGADTSEMYVQGLSTSLPYQVQEEMLASVAGLEHAKIMRYGYAIEYDCLDPTELFPTLESKKIKGLYAAGQANGSSGYEEAAAQGIVAGINAALYLDGKEGIVLRRDQAYIGVMIDDLVTKGVDEPYRMMTSRAEYRLQLRQDNADIRLTEFGRKIGLVKDDRYRKFLAHKKEIEKIETLLSTSFSPAALSSLFEEKGEPAPKSGMSAKEFLKRTKLSAEDLVSISPLFQDCSMRALKYVETELKYEGYLEKQRREIREEARLEGLSLPTDFDYNKVDGLLTEARQKLQKIRPLTLAQASRISGVTPADITVLIIYLKKRPQLK